MPATISRGVGRIIAHAPKFPKSPGIRLIFNRIVPNFDRARADFPKCLTYALISDGSR
jgi:hypothetical protein